MPTYIFINTPLGTGPPIG